MDKIISLLLKLFGDSPSKIWSEFGRQELAKFKKAYEELMGVFEEIKEKDNE